MKRYDTETFSNNLRKLAAWFGLMLLVSFLFSTGHRGYIAWTRRENDALLTAANYTASVEKPETLKLDAMEALRKNQDVKIVEDTTKTLLEKLEAKEFYKLHGYAKGPVEYSITLAKGQISKAYESQYVGTLYCNDWGFSVQCYYPPHGDNGQSFIDASGKAAVLNAAFGSYPFGVGASVVGDHNTQTGYLWANARAGQLLYADTPYGQFIYEVVRVGFADVTSGGRKFVMQDDGLEIISTARSGGFGCGLVLYTCYPFSNTSGTTVRWVVFAQLKEGTQLE